MEEYGCSCSFMDGWISIFSAIEPLELDVRISGKLGSSPIPLKFNASSVSEGDILSTTTYIRVCWSLTRGSCFCCDGSFLGLLFIFSLSSAHLDFEALSLTFSSSSLVSKGRGVFSSNSLPSGES